MMDIDKLKAGLRSLKRWLPVIWRDRDWDTDFIWIILRHKLIGVEARLRRGYFVGAEKQADHVQEAILILGRLIADNYHDLAFRSHYLKWGEPDFNFVDVPGSLNRRLVITYPNVPDAGTEKQEKKEYRNLMNQEQYLRQQDLEYLCGILCRNAFRWWD